MNCPKCNTKHRGSTTRVCPQTMADVALAQQRRLHRCLKCSWAWETLEIDRAELRRLRELAHKAVMHEL